MMIGTIRIDYLTLVSRIVFFFFGSVLFCGGGGIFSPYIIISLPQSWPALRSLAWCLADCHLFLSKAFR